MTTDCFAVLDEPRRPWIDAVALREKFLALSAEVHPDRVHGAGQAERQAAQQRYTELNAAHHCLREPKERLRHLLELERGEKPVEAQRVPDALMDLYLEVSRVCREADSFLEEQGRVSSPLLRAEAFGRGQEISDRLAALRKDVDSRREALVAELKDLDEAWIASGSGSSVRGTVLGRLEEVWRLLGYFGKWVGQLQERIVRISTL